ncbi:MAG: hypothetical protein RLZZ293_956, partial [Pseudomonadota bacterium]
KILTYYGFDIKYGMHVFDYIVNQEIKHTLSYEYLLTPNPISSFLYRQPISIT